MPSRANPPARPGRRTRPRTPPCGGRSGGSWRSTSSGAPAPPAPSTPASTAATPTPTTSLSCSGRSSPRSAARSLSAPSSTAPSVPPATPSPSMMEAHPEMELHVGMDVDPSALEIGQRHIEAFLASRATEEGGEDALQGTLRAYTHVKNFKYIKHVLGGVDESLADGSSGVDGILIDLGMSSMQVNRSDRGFSVLNDGPLDMRMDPKATLTAEDILNSWPELEVGRILRDYGEESNWQSLQRRIVKERKTGGLHSTGELVKLIQRTCTISGGRQGWIKTATRVFQALRIAVNDELQTLEDALHSCFDCLAPDGRLAVISFHSLEDRIVKQTFLELISGDEADDDDEDLACADIDNEDEPWFKQRVQGTNGTVLTKRPITPSQEEEKLNQRCRSAKLRVIQKA
uniref:Ribosomal RNA small subunit methyltransferase H n=1 Tax=Aegilops tauschii subsp. strangulata TaxID=200361 RepID=A0A453N8W4_AEGTS